MIDSAGFLVSFATNEHSEHLPASGRLLPQPRAPREAFPRAPVTSDSATVPAPAGESVMTHHTPHPAPPRSPPRLLQEPPPDTGQLLEPCPPPAPSPVCVLSSSPTVAAHGEPAPARFLEAGVETGTCADPEHRASGGCLVPITQVRPGGEVASPGLSTEASPSWPRPGRALETGCTVEGRGLVWPPLCLWTKAGGGGGWGEHGEWGRGSVSMFQKDVLGLTTGSGLPCKSFRVFPGSIRRAQPHRLYSVSFLDLLPRASLSW